MSRPRGRRTNQRKIGLFASERDRILLLCPAGSSSYQRISYLAREIALGKYHIDTAESDWAPPEIVEERAKRTANQLGRTKGVREQRDIGFFAAEALAFEENTPDVTFQTFWRELAAGRYVLRANADAVKLQEARAAQGLCGLCGKRREDSGEYCQACRGVAPDVAAA